MDFRTIIHKAQKNETTKKEPIRYYSTKFEPPKKEQRNKDQLSINVRKFLEKKEQEEKQRRLEAQARKEELIALRSKDKKAVKRVNVMLKRTKSANQSAIQDAVDKNDTAITLAGPAQPDEDDYGYVSQEASAFYNKMMEKYNKLPQDQSKFSLDKKRVSTNLNSTKDRVRAALEREKEEAMMPHKRKRKPKEDNEEVNDKKENVIDDYKEEKKVKKDIPRKPAPPPMSFNDILKLAEKKQFEPIVIEKKPKEEENPLTKKQKREMEKVREWQERKNDKVKPKDVKPVEKQQKQETVKKDIKKPTKVEKPVEIQKPKIDWGAKHPGYHKMKTTETPKPNIQTKQIPNGSNSKSNITKEESKKPKPLDTKPKSQTNLIKQKQLPPKQYQPAERPKPFEGPRYLPQPPSNVRRKPQMKINKGRILDDDDEDYDSEMDDFIDDGPEEEQDYSKYISEIFGYNKSKYADIDDDDDHLMESTFAQQMKEEVISTKLGIKEDLEDMKLEEEHKRKKALMKKKMNKK